MPFHFVLSWYFYIRALSSFIGIFQYTSIRKTKKKRKIKEFKIFYVCSSSSHENYIYTPVLARTFNLCRFFYSVFLKSSSYCNNLVILIHRKLLEERRTICFFRLFEQFSHLFFFFSLEICNIIYINNSYHHCCVIYHTYISIEQVINEN